MQALWEKIKVVLKSAPTWLSAIAVLLTTVSDEIASLLAPENAEAIVALLTKVVAWLGTAIVVIRRVAPVSAEERGILSPTTPSA